MPTKTNKNTEPTKKAVSKKTTAKKTTKAPKKKVEKAEVVIEKDRYIGMFGRPVKYQTPEQLWEKVEQYFLWGYNTRKITTSDWDTIEIPIITMTDLAFFLWFDSRQSLYDYEKKWEDFSYIIKKARLLIEREYEERLQWNNPSGSIFALKNMGWKDKTETEHSGNVMPTVIEVVKPSKAIE